MAGGCRTRANRDVRDVTQEGLGLVVLGNSKGLIPLVADSGLIQEFSNLGDATLWQPLIRDFGAVI